MRAPPSEKETNWGTIFPIKGGEEGEEEKGEEQEVAPTCRGKGLVMQYMQVLHITLLFTLVSTMCVCLQIMHEVTANYIHNACTFRLRRPRTRNFPPSRGLACPRPPGGPEPPLLPGPASRPGGSLRTEASPLRYTPVQLVTDVTRPTPRHLPHGSYHAGGGCRGGGGGGAALLALRPGTVGQDAP